MKTQIVAVLLLVGALLVPWTVSGKERKQTGPAAPIGWLYLEGGSRSLSVPEPDLQKATRTVPRGALLPVFKTKEKHGATFAQVAALNLKAGILELGWVEITSSELKPRESYPLDSELKESLGGAYLEDFASEHTDIARFLVRQSTGPPVLLCYVVTMPRSTAKLVIFTQSQGKYSPTVASSIPLTEMQAGITSFEVRDLVGNGSDCVITKEPFREQANTYGTNLRIRKVVNGQLQVVWQAPIEFRNLSQYSPKLQILQPPELNIGTPGSVTTGEVTFHPSSKGHEVVWKGKIEFFVFGRDRAVNAVDIEKVCPWNGKEFLPLR
jgi:hypothetical protein